jgi:CBS domain-containing protein
MRSGPTTFRPNVPVKEIAERMCLRNLRTVVVTTSDGRLVGLLRREDAERVAETADMNAQGQS